MRLLLSLCEGMRRERRDCVCVRGWCWVHVYGMRGRVRAFGLVLVFCRVHSSEETSPLHLDHSRACCSSGTPYSFKPTIYRTPHNAAHKPAHQPSPPVPPTFLHQTTAIHLHYQSSPTSPTHPTNHRLHSLFFSCTLAKPRPGPSFPPSPIKTLHPPSPSQLLLHQ